MRIAVLTDVHANLPALEAAFKSIDKEGCDLIVHTGDLIGIGPFPKECCDIFLDRKDSKFIMGNHDAWFVNGLPEPIPSFMSPGEVEHHHWVHSQLDESHRQKLASWPYEWTSNFEGLKISFVHYGLIEKKNNFVPIAKVPSVEYLDKIFDDLKSEIVFYGHDHVESNLKGKKHYINRGAFGCNNLPLARYAILDVTAQGNYSVEQRVAEYDSDYLFQEFEIRKVPEREFIKTAFFS